MSGASHLFALVEAWREGKGEGSDYMIRSWAEEVQWYEDYAEGTHNTAGECGVVSANWNEIATWRNGERIVISDIPKRMGDLFERHGVSIEWCDTTAMCGGCYKCIQTEPDCMSWTPGFMVGDGEILCSGCIAEDPEPWLSQCSAEGHHWSINTVDPAEHGYVLAFEGRDFVYVDRLAADMERDGFYPKDWLFTQSRSYECDVYVKEDAWGAYQARQAAKEAAQKDTTFKLCIPVTAARYREAVECYEGWCPSCTDWTVESCEPDARDRHCDQCERDWAMGAEWAILSGLIEVVK